MSTPFVSAVVALILQACPGLNQATVQALLQSSASQAVTGFAEVEELVDAAQAAADSAAACTP
jgi:hypothetical protein